MPYPPTAKGSNTLTIRLNQRLATAAIATIAATAGTLALAAPAMAKSATCTTSIQVAGKYGHTITVPAYASGYDGATVIYSDNCVLAQGDSGNGVKALQRGINTTDPSGAVSVDGDFGRGTKAELDFIQSAMNIPANGAYGPQTRDVMCWPIVGKGSDCDFHS